MPRFLLALAACLPALPAFAAQDLACGVQRICTGPATELSCVDLPGPETLHLSIPDQGNGTIGSGDVSAELVIDRRLSGLLDMSYLNTLDGFRVVLQLEPETGRMVAAQLAGGDFELAELACTEAG